MTPSSTTASKSSSPWSRSPRNGRQETERNLGQSSRYAFHVAEVSQMALLPCGRRTSTTGRWWSTTRMQQPRMRRGWGSHASDRMCGGGRGIGNDRTWPSTHNSKALHATAIIQNAMPPEQYAPVMLLSPVYAPYTTPPEHPLQHFPHPLLCAPKNGPILSGVGSKKGSKITENTSKPPVVADQ